MQWPQPPTCQVELEAPGSFEMTIGPQHFCVFLYLHVIPSLALEITHFSLRAPVHTPSWFGHSHDPPSPSCTGVDCNLSLTTVAAPACLLGVDVPAAQAGERRNWQPGWGGGVL